MAFFKNLFAKPVNSNTICAPVAGECVPLSDVSDPTFSQEILGKGVAIRPANGRICAPCDATVDMVFDTGHAVSLLTDYDAEILMHIGLETLNLKGRHFKVHAAIGDKVTKGSLLIEFDLDAVTAEGYDPITPVVVCNSGDYSVFEVKTGMSVAVGDPIIQLDK